MTLAEASAIDRTTVVPIINRFVRLGWVKRSRRSEDRRMYSLHVTAAGRSILDRALSLIEAHEEQLVKALSPQERAQP
jgi:DNA-binding MarR family transcriptional regulator